MLNKQKGNMYPWVTHTFNPIKGKCSHDCSYCYMKRFSQKPIRLVESELKEELGYDNFIFVGSSTDMFARDVPADWIKKVLTHCRNYKNKYLFQTKNPIRFEEFKQHFPIETIYGTTIESNRHYCSDAPSPAHRFEAMCIWSTYDFVTDMMVTIEPIMDFDLDILIMWMKNLKPTWVNIGADSKGHNLKEPSKEKVIALVEELKEFTEVKLKDNLKRLM